MFGVYPEQSTLKLPTSMGNVQSQAHTTKSERTVFAPKSAHSQKGKQDTLILLNQDQFKVASDKWVV